MASLADSFVVLLQVATELWISSSRVQATAMARRGTIVVQTATTGLHR